MTTVYLALGGSLPPIALAMSSTPAPSVLCSYVVYPRFKPVLMGEVGTVREWVLDSGAYSAKHSGIEISIEQYIDFCHEMNASKRPPSAIFALDVIGDWRGTMTNTELMWKRGVEAIPCYHAGEPSDVLGVMARDYPRIAIGGSAGVLYGKDRNRYFDAVFAKVWPKRIHGFGITTQDILSAYPFHSVDASSWELGVLRYGTWKAHRGLKTPWLRRDHNLRIEVEHYLDMEAQLRVRWARQMKELEDACGPLTATS